MIVREQVLFYSLPHAMLVMLITCIKLGSKDLGSHL